MMILSSEGNLRSGNSIDVIEWLERGLVDFAVLIAFPDVNRFAHVRLHPTDTWGVLMPAGHPLAQKEAVGPRDLADLPLIVSGQALETGELSQWFGDLHDRLAVVATYNLAFNAAQLVREGVGCALTLDKLVATGEGTGFEFRPIYPPVVSTIDFVWKPDRVQSNAAKAFLGEMKHASE